MQRKEVLARLDTAEVFDLLIIGGGATGLGLAVDASSRGLKTALVEADDFGKGTSSRSTKLVHGGVRYLAQGRMGLVREALHERATLLANAPHLVSPLPFVVPCRGWFEKGFYGLGLKAYAALAGSRSLGPTESLSAAALASAVPGLKEGLAHGGWRYWDAQFDDARLALALARTAQAQGAVMLNHGRAVGLLHEPSSGRYKTRVCGAIVEDVESGRRHRVAARCVVNATGVWVDSMRRMSQGGGSPPLVSPSQGVHLVVDAGFLGGDHALLSPRTADGRVVFAVPWLGSTVLGTTDTPREDLPLDPQPLPGEVDFILQESARFLRRAPERSDVRSAWVGLRPLVKPQREEGATGSLSREHVVQVGLDGLVTVTGGKWTTYRAMAEDVLERAREADLLPTLPACTTATSPLIGAPVHAGQMRIAQASGWHLYGTEASRVQSMPGADHVLTSSASVLTEAMVRYAVRHEMARTVEDVLARRSRLLFLDAAQAMAVAPAVSALVAEERGCAIKDTRLLEFEALARQYAKVGQTAHKAQRP